MSLEETQREQEEIEKGVEMEMRLKPLQDALFPCSYPVIEDLWTSGRIDIVGNELSPLHCNNYFEGRWTGQDNKLYGPSELCGNERSASPSPFTELLSAMSVFVESHVLLLGLHCLNKVHDFLGKSKWFKYLV